MSRPSFATHLVLLWALRLRIALNRRGPARWWLAVPAFVASSFPALVLASTFYALMRLDAVTESPIWSDFILRLLSFVTSCVLVTWPMLSAGVDDHSELSRYAAFPISSFRLMLASTLAGLFEPRSLVFYGPLLGATVGYARMRPPEHGLLVFLAGVAYVLFNAAVARVGMHIVLDVLRQKRSAELLGGGFLVTLLFAALIPPVDTSWLFRFREAGMQAVPDTLLFDAALALGRFPTGYFAHALSHGRDPGVVLVVADLAALAEWASVALVVAWGLLIDFHRQSGGGGPQNGATRRANPFAHTRTLFGTLVTREALDLWHNPRARLLVSVPFLLAILLRLLSGRDLLVFFLGASADAWLLGGLCVYGAVVMGSTFSQNAFAYDGQGFSVFLAAPLELGLVLKAKNLVHALAGATLAVAVGVFYRLYFGHGALLDAALAIASVATLIPCVLTVGNFLSLYFPVKFHVNLKRKDRLPFAASMIGIGAAAVGTSPFAWALRLAGRDGPTLGTLARVTAAALAGWGLYRLTLPWALTKLTLRRELVLRAVTRE